MVGPKLIDVHPHIFTRVILKSNQRLDARHIGRKVVDIIKRDSCPMGNIAFTRCISIGCAINIGSFFMKALEARLKINIDGAEYEDGKAQSKSTQVEQRIGTVS